MDIGALSIPSNKKKQFQSAGINTLEDLLLYFPKQYAYYGDMTPYNEFPQKVGESISVCGTVESVTTNFKKVIYATVVIKSRNGQSINAVWFNQRHIGNLIYTGMFILVHGKLSYNEKYQSYSIFPDYFCTDINHFNDIIPVYKKIHGMSNDYIRFCVKTVLDTTRYEDLFQDRSHIDDELAKKVGVCDLYAVLHMAHFPKTQEDCKKVEQWVTADILAAFAIEMAIRKKESSKEAKFVLDEELAEKAQVCLQTKIPYELTKDQKSAIQTMTNIMCSKKRLNALLQGDVGCGKTIVAFMMAYAAVSCGYQVAIMAPTFVLAEQHFNDLKKLMQDDVAIAFLHSSLKAAEKRKIYAKIASGEIKIVVGTHAVLGDDVNFHNLALTVVDEEHRFGVLQREKLMKKAASGTHHISMSATPIPRSLALATISDDVIVQNIKTMPSGRVPVITIAYSNTVKTYEAMLRQVRAGHQCYVICPLIHDSDSERMTDIVSVESAYEDMERFYAKCPDVRIAAITGKMKPKEIQERIDAFKAGIIHILISTTIVEVGVNVPNATVMVICNAERFGLAQLHQLRGRVGRSSFQSYCVLLTKNKMSERIQVMVKSNDGFVIAEEDMKLRGTGNLVGVEQSGYDKCVTLMLQNQELYSRLYGEAIKIAEANETYMKYLDLANKRFGKESVDA